VGCHICIKSFPVGPVGSLQDGSGVSSRLVMAPSTWLPTKVWTATSKFATYRRGVRRISRPCLRVRTCQVVSTSSCTVAVVVPLELNRWQDTLGIGTCEYFRWKLMEQQNNILYDYKSLILDEDSVCMNQL